MLPIALFVLMQAASAADRPLDIRSFGAACDGVTDDAGAVQAAFNTLEEGDTLLFPCTAAIGATGLELRDKTAVAIRGVANGGLRALRRTNLSVGGFSPVMFAVRNCTRCVVQSLVIDMNEVGEAALGLDRSSETMIRYNHISRVGMPAPAGIVSAGNRDCAYIGNVVKQTAKSSTDGVRGMWIGNLGDLQEEWHPLVSANVVEDAGATGIVVYGRSITVSGNTVIRTSGAGIKVNTRSVAGDDRATQSRIDSNVLQQNLFHGLQIERGEGGLLIEGNRLETNQDSGLYVFGGSFSGRIAGNSFFSNREVGVYLYEASGVTIEANQFGSMAAAPQKVGIVLEALRGRSVKDVTIVRNEIWDQQLDGVALRARSGQLDAIGIDANAIGGRSRSGVRLEADDGAPVGSIVVGSNCFDLQLTRTVVDTRTGGLAVPFASDCAALRPGAVP